MKTTATFFIFSITLSFCLLAATPSLHAGAWTQKKGEGLSITTYSLYNTHDTFDLDGDEIPISQDGTFTKQSINQYIEYGLTERFTLLGNFFYDFVKFNNATGQDTHNGFSDQEVGIRIGILQGDPVLSFQNIIKIPAYSLNTSPILGNDQIDIEQRVLLGHTHQIWKWHAYTNIEWGYRERLEGPSDQIRFQALEGIDWTPDWYTTFQLDGTYGVGASRPQVIGNNITVNTDHDLLRGTLALGHRLTPNFSIQGSVFRHLTGSLTGAGLGVELSLRSSF